MNTLSSLHILSSFLFAISANVDNFAVGLSYGIKKIKIGYLSNFLIALISSIGTIIAMIVGKAIFTFLPEVISNYVGSAILILIGLWTISKSLLKNKYIDNILENPERADIDKSSTIDVRESIVLALALTINNIGLSIGASITGLNILITSLLTFVFSIFMIVIGYLLGERYLSRVFSKKATVISGIIIVILGIYETFN